MYNNSTNMFSTNVASVTQTTVFHIAGANTVQLKQFCMTMEVCKASSVYFIHHMNK